MKTSSKSEIRNIMISVIMFLISDLLLVFIGIELVFGRLEKEFGKFYTKLGDNLGRIQLGEILTLTYKGTPWNYPVKGQHKTNIYSLLSYQERR